MKFGRIPTTTAEGAILAHTLRTADAVFKKGHVLATSDLEELKVAGHETVIAARLESGDIGEDEAATLLAERIATDDSVSLGVAGTGRVNIYASKRGLLILSSDLLDQINEVDEAVTVSTVAPFAQVEPGQLVATVKIIPFAVSGHILSRCEELAAEPPGTIRVAPFRSKKTGLLQTILPEFKQSLLEKGRSVTESRLSALELTIDEDRVCNHDEDSIRLALTSFVDAGCEIILLLGASAITDRRDVIPSAVVSAGGEIIQLGMPVDPGNLTLLARIRDSWILGLPGSARSPRLHGSDWLLHRLVADIVVSASDIRRMGVGGLLKEIPGRPLPRTEASPPVEDEKVKAHRIGAIILAAGQSRRMGRRNKLLAAIDGRTMIARTVEAVLASRAARVTVVLGHQARQVREALDGLEVDFVENADYEEGLSTSLRRGLAALPQDIDGVLICLGDMPRISASEINQLIDCFEPGAGSAICVPTHDGKRGNPVLLARRFFAEIQEISGDVGARQLIGAYPDLVQEVEMAGDAVLTDIDTPDALSRFTG